jgi:hypothetical protein
MANVRSTDGISTETLPFGIFWGECYMYWITIDWDTQVKF